VSTLPACSLFFCQRFHATHALHLRAASPLWCAFSQQQKLGQCIDVTVPLQCSVKNSTLIVHGGGSKSWLEGFYDPNNDEVS
jgi:hypothetical protein